MYFLSQGLTSMAGTDVPLDFSHCFSANDYKGADLDLNVYFPSSLSLADTIAASVPDPRRSVIAMRDALFQDPEVKAMITPQFSRMASETFSSLPANMDDTKKVLQALMVIRGLQNTALPGLGFCLSPSVTAGPCSSLRKNLLAKLDTLMHLRIKIDLVVPVAAKALASVFGPTMVKASNWLAFTVLPGLAEYIDTGLHWIINITAAIGIEIDLSGCVGCARMLSAPADHPPAMQPPFMRDAGVAAAIRDIQDLLISTAQDEGRAAHGRVLAASDRSTVSQHWLSPLSDDPYVARRQLASRKLLTLNMALLFKILDGVDRFIDKADEVINKIANKLLKAPMDITDKLLKVLVPIQNVLSEYVPYQGLPAYCHSRPYSLRAMIESSLLSICFYPQATLRRG